VRAFAQAVADGDLEGLVAVLDPAVVSTSGRCRHRQVVKAGTKHSIEILDEPAHLRCRVYPALGLQSFLEESAAAGRDGLFMKGGIPRGLRGARWAAKFLKRHREETVMTFPPRPAQAAMIALLGR